MLAAFKAADEVYAELSASNPNWKTIYADFNACRGEANLWFRFAEARFDNFMQSQRLPTGAQQGDVMHAWAA